MTVEFTAHNIRLDNGAFTKPELNSSMETHPWFLSARRVLDAVFPGDKSHYRIADLGCLEGGFAVEFARMGLKVLGLDVRESNIAACHFVQQNTHLPNLEFVQDDAWNIAKYGTFDAIFCSGLLYHLDRPKSFLETLAPITRSLLILQTHFAVDTGSVTDQLPAPLRRVASPLLKGKTTSTARFRLSPITEHDSVRGRWFTEFSKEEDFREREKLRWASWDNRSSFWIQKEYLLQAIQDVGFDLVMEQFDGLGPDLAETMTHGYYKTESRGTFIGIKTQRPDSQKEP